MAEQYSQDSSNCPACGGTLGDVFYETGRVPVHSCILLATAEQALNFPKDEVRLAPCLSCGFVTNVNFDPKLSAYSPDYEDQQSFSPTFSSFAGTMAKSLVERHQLHGKRVVEVGCSKGDFLVLLAELGDMQTTGIDPSAIPGRVAQPSRGSLELIADYYADEHTEIPADLICHRHTLEHIHDISTHLSLLHRHASKTEGSVVFIEVPCALRVFRDLTFEDIYYEHTSYFTPGSLASALRHAGFGVLRIWHDYDGQYLLAEASADPGKDNTHEIEESTRDTLAIIERFQQNIAEEIDYWRREMRRPVGAIPKTAIWGSGSKCIAFLHATESADCVGAIIDINPYRSNRFIPGVATPVSHMKDLENIKPKRVVVMNGIYAKEIASACASSGINPEYLVLGEHQPELSEL